MDYSRTKVMQQPNDWWIPIFKWLQDNTIMFMCFALVWKAIDRAFKYLSESRDGRIKTIVKNEIEPLHKMMEDMQESIWNLKK